MTATAVRTTQALAEWTSVFPRQVNETYTSSATFMKQLSVVAVSTITYLKNAFPEDNYTEDLFGGLKIRVLKNKCTDELAQFLITSLTHAFEAFDKKYLHQIALCFYEDDCQLENLLEYHILEFTYMDEGVSMSISSKSRGHEGGSMKCTMSDIKDRTVQLLRACMIMMSANSQQLPDAYDVSLRLYYNDDAPDGYQAPGFLAARPADDPLGTTFEQTIKLGWVQTPFHRLLARTYFRDQLEASHEAIPSQNTPVLTQQPSAAATQHAAFVRCSCNCTDTEDVMLTCQHCKSQQHGSCYGLTPQQATRLALVALVDSDDGHCCVVCADARVERRATDQQLADAGKRACYAIFRRALAYCASVASLDPRNLSRRFNLSVVSASKLVGVLHAQGVVCQDANPDSLTPIPVLHDQLKSIMKKYFRTEEDIVDRLVEETFASDDTPDPVGDVLGPLEKVSLQNAHNIGRVIEPELNNNNADDPTLKQYREAIVIAEKLDDLPFMSSQESLREYEIKATKRKAEGKENKKSGVKTKKARIIRK